MFRYRRVLALAMACALLLAAAPGAAAASFSGMTGTWSGSGVYYTMTITLYDNGTYSTAIVQGGQTYQYSGYYSADAYYMYFWPNGGTQSALSYRFTGDTLTLTDWGTGETILFTRQQPLYTPAPHAPVIPAGLAGTWTGDDDGSIIFIDLEEDGEITIAYDTPEPIDQMGTFTAANGLFEAEFYDGSTVSFLFLLTGDTLIFAGEEGETLTLTRMREPFVPPSAPPETFAPMQTPDVPRITPSPVPAIPMPTEFLAPPTAAPTEAPAVTVPPAPLTPGPMGVWQGTDAMGAKKLTLTPDGRIEIAYEQEEASRRAGTYILDSSTITAAFEDGSTEIFRYILMGDTLLLTDAQLGNPLTMTRWLPPPPAPAAIDPAVLGTWGGTDGEYGEMTLRETGELDLFIPSDPSHCVTYSFRTQEGRIIIRVEDRTVEGDYAVQGNVLTITFPEKPISYTKKPGPLARQEMPEQTAAATVDAALIGTWGGLEGGVYGETTLYGDGTYAKFIPEDESLSVNGTYMANGGILAVLLPGGALQGTYAMEAGELTLTWQNAEPLQLFRQTGPLIRLAQTGES